jgi:hypothetical protein
VSAQRQLCSVPTEYLTGLQCGVYNVVPGFNPSVANLLGTMPKMPYKRSRERVG